MKKCKYCDTLNQNENTSCPTCAANEFDYVCDNCGELFDEGLYCPKCGVKFGTEAKVCPKCGTKYFSNACPDCGYVKSNSDATDGANTVNVNTNTSGARTPRQKRFVILFSIYLVVLVICFILILCFPLVNRHEDDSVISSTTSAFAESLRSDDGPDTVVITLSEYDQIETGMTYQEVVDIVGGEGTLNLRSGTEGTQYYTESYTFAGIKKHAYATFIFQDGKLYSRYQSGLTN